MLFSKQHLWIDENDGIAQIGISDYGQEKLRSILFINLPEVEDELSIGGFFGDVESVKTVFDLHSPVTGTVVEVNDDLIDEPDAINESPYESWLFKIKVVEKSSDLMTESEYEDYIKTL